MKIFKKDLNKKIILVGEIGINHEGKFKEAFKILKLAASCGLDAVKFQLYSTSKYESKNNKKRYSRLEKYNLKDEDYIILKDKAEKIGLNVLATPLTEDKVSLAANLSEVIKVASGDINFFPTLDKIINKKKKIILSTGNATIKEIENTIKYLKKRIKNIKNKIALLHCVSRYPAPIEKSNIQKITYLKKKFPNITIGYSNHCCEKEAVLAAVSLGAKIIEIHITYDKRNKNFRDHQLSFDKNNLKDLVDSIKLVQKSTKELSINPENEEVKLRKFMRKGIIASKDIKKGEKFTKKNTQFARPALYFQSKDIKKIIGKISKRNVKSGFIIN